MRNYLRQHRAKLVWIALLLLVPGLAMSQSRFQGIYLGTFQGRSDAGEFALLINDRNRGLFAAYDTVDDDGFTERNVYIRADGSFRLVTRQGYRIDGRIAAGKVSGRYTAGNTAGVFTGRRAADQGPLADAAGFYSGPVSLSRTGSGAQVKSNTRLVAIVAADGRAFFLLDRAFASLAEFSPSVFGRGLDWPFSWNWDWGFDFHIPFFPSFEFDFDVQFNLPTFDFAWPWHYPLTPISASGGIIQLAPNGHVKALLLDGLVLQGRLDPITGSGHGTLSQVHKSTRWSGNWLLERRPVDGFRSVTRHRLADFDGDGREDILWRHTVTGENAVWLMDSGAIQAELPLEAQQDLGWTLVAVDELDGDQQPDFVWQHPDSGELLVWFSNDTDSLPIQLDASWQVVGSGNFLADRRSEILVRHRVTGENGLVVDPAGQTSLLPLPSMPDLAWSLVAVAHFDDDSHPDILWRHQDTAELLIWRMQGRRLIQELSISSQTAERLELSGVGDFDGDGTDDLLWRHHLTGETTVWRIANALVVSSESLTPVADRHWTIQP